MARLLSRDVGAQHGPDRRAGPVDRRRQFSMAVARAGARARLVSTAQFDRLVAEHDGYRRLADPVTHRRELLLDRATCAVTIVDELFCRASHAVEMFWHFAEGCEVTLDGTRVTARNGSRQLAIEVPQGTRCELVRGREDVPLGWISRRFDQLAPTSTLLVQGTAEATPGWLPGSNCPSSPRAPTRARQNPFRIEVHCMNSVVLNRAPLRKNSPLPELATCANAASR